MRRYKLHHYAKLSIVLLVLGGTCAAQLPEITLRLLAVEAVLDEQLVVVDANDVEVGDWMSNNVVAFAFEGVPPFVLRVDTGIGLFSLGELAFLSEDCSGIPFMYPSRGFTPHVYIDYETGVTFVAESTGVVMFPPRSKLGGSGTCQTGTYGENEFTPDLIPVPQMEGRFTPPFRLVRRGDLPDIWDLAAE